MKRSTNKRKYYQLTEKNKTINQSNISNSYSTRSKTLGKNENVLDLNIIDEDNKTKSNRIKKKNKKANASINSDISNMSTMNSCKSTLEKNNSLSDIESIEENDQDKEIFYEVENIVGKKIVKGKVFYKVKWEGYRSDLNTWEPLDNLLNVINMIEDYEEFNSKANSKRKKTLDRQVGTEVGIEVIRKIAGEEEREGKRELVREVGRENKIKTMDVKEEFLIPLIMLAKFDFPKDIPIRIIGAKKILDDLYFMTEFHKRSDGIKPDNDYLAHEILYKHYPYILLDFYETRIKFQ